MNLAEKPEILQGITEALKCDKKFVFHEMIENKVTLWSKLIIT